MNVNLARRDVTRYPERNVTCRMFKQLLRSNHHPPVSTRNVPASLCLIRRTNGEKLKKSLAETFGYIVRRSRMDIDEKMKELADLFVKTGKELGELVKKNEQFITDEMLRVEEAVRTATEVCARGKMDALKTVKDEYARRVKICNEKAAAGLRSAKTKCDQQLMETEALRNTMKQILRECMETDDFVKCVAGGTKEATNRRKEITQELNDAVKSAENSVTEQLVEAAKCHADAQAKALASLQEILKDTKDCIAKHL